MSTDAECVLKGALLPDGRVADISIAGGKIIHVGAGRRADRTIDCTGLLCLPGAVDMHVHMRGGKDQGYKEDWTSGTQSALAGGVTMVVDQPNTLPPLTDKAAFAGRVAEATRDAYCRFGVNGYVSGASNIAALWEAGALAFGETFAAASSYGSAVSPEELGVIFAEIADLDALVTLHCEDVLPGDDTSLEAHAALRPEAGEKKCMEMLTARFPPGLSAHFCHLSSPISAEAAMAAMPATYEVMPHHLFLSIEEHGSVPDGHCKVNPPVRHEKVRKALWEMWDAIPVIASDHAPHTIAEKSQAFSAVPSGIPGVETMVPLLLAQVYRGRIALSSLLEKVVYTPAHLLGIPASTLMAGTPADLALYPRKETETITAELLHSRAGWTPYEGMQGVFPHITCVSGHLSYLRNEFSRAEELWVPGRGYKTSGS
ncbi:amidohydrolase family protein [Methanogenium organophilum]|uniref:Amidohydrolase family protein n=1 Tax=Methanogenium organophilum TaxID=2199 RepID=A0A9X9T7B7_METOG|nr:amidohydrolase family protein [Methanogenium organophilum]WAI00894.1 amidohydrolase family protein [Methanogenium organophilum]